MDKETLFKLSSVAGSGLLKRRWGRLLKQQSSITIYHLPTKKNKLPFSVSV
jgi:hypothetical protein